MVEWVAKEEERKNRLLHAQGECRIAYLKQSAYVEKKRLLEQRVQVRHST